MSEINTNKKARIYPNPSTGQLFIETNNNDYSSVTLLNAIGQVHIKTQLTQGSSAIDITALPAGIYYVELKGNAGRWVQKIQKL